ANTPLGDDLLQQAIASIIATHETDLDQSLAESNFGIKDALAGGCGGRQGFLTEHRLAGCNRRQNEFFMGRTDGGDNNSIHILGCDDFLSGGLGTAAKVLRNLLSSPRIDVSHCDHTCPGQCLSNTPDMILPNVSGSNNSDIDRHFWNANFRV